MMLLLKALFWIMFWPFKLLFFWLPSGKDSYETDDDEWLFWKDHGHDW